MPEPEERYIIIVSMFNIPDLDRHLNELVEEGYIPYGNMIIHAQDALTTLYIQPMILSKIVK